ncbi:hypothetical protein ACFLZ8_00305 [Planctomycetota bacterium]
MSASVLLSIIALKKEFAQEIPPDTPELILAIVAGIGVPIAIAVLFVLLRLETEVRSDGLYVRFSPFHIRFKRFDPEDLSEYYARQYKPVREYGGWGIRCGLFGKGRAYNVSGNKGVQLVFNDGKKLLIGSQRAEELEQAIRSIIS